MVSKMKQNTALDSRVAEIHNGSSLFTGSAGSGESNVRRWIIENDCWRPSSRCRWCNLSIRPPGPGLCARTSGRRTVNYRTRTSSESPLRFVEFKESEQSKIFPCEEFGYWKIRVRRPLRLRVDLSSAALERFRAAVPRLRTRR